MLEKKSDSGCTLIAAGHACAGYVARGSKIRVIQLPGTQVIDCWACNTSNTGEFMSIEHCRVSFERYRPQKGDAMVTNQRRRILKILEDAADGAHDTLLATCDRYRYQQIGCKNYHRNCTDNLWKRWFSRATRSPRRLLHLIYGRTPPSGQTGPLSRIRQVTVMVITSLCGPK